MKRYGNTYEKIYSPANVALAHMNASRGKAHYREVKKINAEPEPYLNAISEMLKNKTFRNSPYTFMVKTDSGKRREIYKLPYYPDRIVHHAIMQVLGPIWEKSMIHDTYASIQGRGIHMGVKRIKKALQDRENTRYCLKMDVRKFYPSIDNGILKQLLRKKLKDPDTLWLLDEIIDSQSGLPIGNYLSQILANLYLNDFDHRMKEDYKCRYYFRYCDDIVIMHRDKAVLHNIRRTADEMLHELNLTMKSNWQIFPVDARGIDFLGYKFFHDYTLVRKSLAKKFKRKVRSIEKYPYAYNDTEILSSLASYLGWFKHANAQNLKNAFLTSRICRIVDKSSQNLNCKNPLRRLAV